MARWQLGLHFVDAHFWLEDSPRRYHDRFERRQPRSCHGSNQQRMGDGACWPDPLFSGGRLLRFRDPGRRPDVADQQFRRYLDTHGIYRLGGGTSANGSLITVNTTGSLALDLQVQFGTASTSNNLQLTSGFIEIIG